MTEAERLAAACVFPGFPGLEPPDWVRRRLQQGLGGVVLFAWNVRDPEQVARLVEALRAERPDVVVAIDEEGGDVTRLEAATGSSYPGNLALGAVDDVDLTRRVASSMGAELRAVGVDLNLAPVADVLANTGSGIVGVRSFGSDAGSWRARWAPSSRGSRRRVWPRARSTSPDTATLRRTRISTCRWLSRFARSAAALSRGDRGGRAGRS